MADFYIVKMGDYGKVGYGRCAYSRFRQHKKTYKKSVLFFKRWFKYRFSARKKEFNFKMLIKSNNLVVLGLEYFIWEDKLVNSFLRNGLK